MNLRRRSIAQAMGACALAGSTLVAAMATAAGPDQEPNKGAMSLGGGKQKPSKTTGDFLAYAGLPTFWRAPHTQDLTGVDIAVMGVPFDIGVSNRPGARLGPRAIRKASLHVGNFQHPWKYNIAETLKIIDYGDVGMGVGGDATNRMIADTHAHAKKIFDSGAKLFTIGGDHTIPYGMVRAAREKYGPVALIHFDSHQDSMSSNGGTEIFHGSFAHDLAKEGSVNARKSAQVFIRTDMPNEMGYNIIYAQDALYQTPDMVAKKIRSVVGDMPVYITFDIDALDPSSALGTGTPVPGGPSTFQASEVLRRLAGLNVVGADLVEVAAMYDPSGLTTLSAAAIARDLMYLLGEPIKASRPDAP
jgi:agmatinase